MNIPETNSVIPYFEFHEHYFQGTAEPIFYQRFLKGKSDLSIV